MSNSSVEAVGSNGLWLVRLKLPTFINTKNKSLSSPRIRTLHAKYSISFNEFCDVALHDY